MWARIPRGRAAAKPPLARCGWVGAVALGTRQAGPLLARCGKMGVDAPGTRGGGARRVRGAVRLARMFLGRSAAQPPLARCGKGRGCSWDARRQSRRLLGAVR